MRPYSSKARCAAAAIGTILISALFLNLQAQESRRESPQPIEAVRSTSRSSGKTFMEEARELAQILETNPMLEIKSKRMSPFSEVVLLRYAALGQKRMPMLVAAKQGRSAQVEALLKEVGAKVYFEAPDIDYFRCVVDIDKVVRVFHSDDVLDVHLGMFANIGNEFDGEGFPPPKSRSSAPPASSQASGTKPTEPEAMSTEEFERHLGHARAGLDLFWREHPTYDGRGVVIGQIDGGAIVDPELLVGAKDLRGKTIPKVANAYYPYDVAFDAGWRAVRMFSV